MSDSFDLLVYIDVFFYVPSVPMISNVSILLPTKYKQGRELLLVRVKLIVYQDTAIIYGTVTNIVYSGIS